ncbi:major facilitator superfamily domain-containing protein [Mycotypha africana]|uniref:major facilitator superfamily domain-containing protein n=1 Tax=Mycotypha africana TaxID=64632 RepID=UPI00230192A6|nr:major facilitator superfamily domain-containing protein [Mycotypha africana]KAI8968036.1 major facilitator superfamily domain-containing protein [Mycotypha africana]
MPLVITGKEEGLIKSNNNSAILIEGSTIISTVGDNTEHLEMMGSIDIDSTTLPNEEKLTNNIAEIQYGTTWIAWLQVLSIILVNSACSLMWMSATSSPTAVSEWLNVSFSSLNWLSNVSAIVNTVFSLITGWAYEKFGIKRNIIFSGVMNFLGCWIRCLAIVAPRNHRFAVVMVGQVIASIGGPFVYNIATKLVSIWFAPKHRVIANTLATLSIGMAIAPILIPALAPASVNVPWMLIVISVISTIAAIPSFFLPSKPAILSSPSAEQDRMNIVEGIKRLIKISGFWWSLILCAVNAGMVFSVSVLIMEAIIPLGYTDMEAGYCAAAIVVAGFIGGICSGYWAGKTGQHIMLIKLFTPMMLFSYIILIFELVPNTFPVILIACIQIGFFAYALFPLHLEVACEITYPIPEAITASLMWSMVTAAMLIFCVIIDALRAGPEAVPPNNMKMSINAVAIIVCIGSLPILWFKGDLKRLAYDKNEQTCRKV